MGQVDMVFLDFLMKAKSVFQIHVNCKTGTKVFHSSCLRKKTFYLIFHYLLLSSICVLSCYFS